MVEFSECEEMTEMEVGETREGERQSLNIRNNGAGDMKLDLRQTAPRKPSFISCNSENRHCQSTVTNGFVEEKVNVFIGMEVA